MKRHENSALLFEEGFSVIINQTTARQADSAYYYFDYDKRSHEVNMAFPHFHIFYEMLILLSPKAYHFVEGKRYELETNDIVLLPPSVLHQSEYLPGDPSDRIVISFLLPKHTLDDPGMKALLSVFSTAEPIMRFLKEDQNILFHPLNDIVQISMSNEQESVKNLLIQNRFTEFLYLLYHMKEKNIYESGNPDGMRAKIYAIANYIHTHYQEDLSLNSLADTFFINAYYLSHRFKEVMGYTIVEYIQQTRIKNAQYLLINSGLKITEIAQEAGFSSFSQFNRVFRKFCEMSPSDYKVSVQSASYTAPLPGNIHQQ